MKKAKATALEAVCTSQFKQMGLAATLYARDHNGWFMEKTMVRNEVITEALLSANYPKYLDILKIDNFLHEIC